MATRIPVPKNADELHEALTDPKTMRQLLGDPDTMVEFLENSVNARLKADTDIEGQVGQQTEKFMIDWLRNQQPSDTVQDRLNMALSSPNTRARIRPNTIYNKAALGAKHDAAFASTSEFLHTISEHGFKNAETSSKLDTLKNALSSVKPSDGGFLIPEILRAELLRVSLENAIVRPRARVIPMDSLTVPFPTVDSTSNVSSVYGGVTGYWTEEGATLTESKPRFGRVELKANKLVLYCEVPNELIRDAQPSMEAFINDIFPEALAWFEDVAFFVGSGVGEPWGFLNAPAAVTVTRQASGQSIDWQDIAGMYSRMLPQSLGRAVWIVSPDAMYNLLTMPFIQGGASPILLGNNGTFTNAGQSAAPMTILGSPVIVSEKARALGTAGDINFVDFGFYLLGDRQAMSAAQSQDFRFNTDVTAFRVIERLDGRPWIQNPITPQNNSSNTLSPFVKLS